MGLLAGPRASNLDGVRVGRYDLAVPHLRRTRTALLVRSAALTIFLALIMADAVVGDPAPQQWHFYKQPLSHEVRCFLSVDAAVWKHNGPAMVHMRLENPTDKDLDLAITPSLYLNECRGGHILVPGRHPSEQGLRYSTQASAPENASGQAELFLL